MPAYTYRATNAAGRIQRGSITAANENELAHYLGESGLELIEAKARRVETGVSRLRAFREGSSLRQRILLCGQLEDLLRAGLPLPAALRSVAEAMPQTALRDQLAAVMRDIDNGAGVAASFARHPRAFDAVFVAILAAGESGGDLAATFGRLAQHLRWQDKVRELLRRALRYPLFLLCVALGATGFMMTMVVPQVVGLLLSLDSDLPRSTRWLIAASDAFAAAWWTLPLIAGGGGLATRLLRRHSESAALRLDGWLLRVPVFGPLLRQLAVARFAYSFAALLQSHTPMPVALHTAAAVLNNRALRAAALTAKQRLEAGLPLSAATAELFPPFVTQSLKVGETSGQLPKTLNEVTRHYDAELQATVERLIGALEPALTLLVGGLLAWVVLAVLGPVYGSLGKLSQG